MARKQTNPPKHGNGFDPEEIARYVARIETLQDEKASIMGEAMQRCRSLNGDIKLIYDDAKDNGVPKKALKSVIKARGYTRKAAAVRDQLEGDDQDDYDLIRHALGDLADTPLGQAALPPEGQQNTADTSKQPFRDDMQMAE